MTPNKRLDNIAQLRKYLDKIFVENSIGLQNDWREELYEIPAGVLDDVRGVLEAAYKWYTLQEQMDNLSNRV